MSSNSNNTTTLAENKVLILYILNLIDGDIVQDGLFKIISSINNLNYFYFKQILTDLIDSKLVGVYTKEDEQVLRITSEGKNAYILTKDVMPGILKLKADSVFKKEFSNIEEASSVIAEFTPKDDEKVIRLLPISPTENEMKSPLTKDDINTKYGVVTYNPSIPKNKILEGVDSYVTT